MSRETDLIHNVRLVEKYKQAIPILQDMLAHGNFYYCAGSLILQMSDPTDPGTASLITSINIEDINEYESEIIRKGQYLASKLFVQHKQGSCFYQQALDNVEEYEKEMVID